MEDDVVSSLWKHKELRNHDQCFYFSPASHFSVSSPTSNHFLSLVYSLVYLILVFLTLLGQCPWTPFPTFRHVRSSMQMHRLTSSSMPFESGLSVNRIKCRDWHLHQCRSNSPLTKMCRNLKASIWVRDFLTKSTLAYLNFPHLQTNETNSPRRKLNCQLGWRWTES